MIFYKGERVRYLGKPEWGSGIVLRDSRDGKVRICFDLAGEKLLKIRLAKLLKVRPPPPSRTAAAPDPVREEAEDPSSITCPGAGSAPIRSLKNSVFPG